MPPSTVAGSPGGAPVRAADAGAPLTSRFVVDPAPPFRLDLTVWALRRRPANIVDRWDGDVYRRALHVGGTVAEVEVRQTGPPEAARLDVSVTAAIPIDPAQAQSETTATLRRLLGVDVDLGEFYRQLPPRRAPRPSRGAVPRAQAASVPVPVRVPRQRHRLPAATLNVGIMLLSRLAEAYGPSGPTVSGVAGHAFPDAADLATSTPAGLRQLGLSTRKSEAILQLARRITSGELHLAGLRRSTTKRSARRCNGWSASDAGQPSTRCCEGSAGSRCSPAMMSVPATTSRAGFSLDAPLDYDSVRNVVAPWAPFAGLAYFHFLVERIEAAGWLGDAEGAPADHNWRRQP